MFLGECATGRVAMLWVMDIWAALSGVSEEGKNMKAGVGCFVGITEGKIKEEIGIGQDHISQYTFMKLSKE